jgi:hypothetical protein
MIYYPAKIFNKNFSGFRKNLPLKPVNWGALQPYESAIHFSREGTRRAAKKISTAPLLSLFFIFIGAVRLFNGWQIRNGYVYGIG